MRKTKYTSALIFFTLGFLSMLAPQVLADDQSDQDAFACTNSVNVMDCIEKTKPAAPAEPEPEVIPINGLKWISSGPLSLGVRYDNVLGWIPQASFVQMFYDNGISAQLGYGANEQRANVTLGHSFSPHQQIKLTYEYLAQNLPFDFASGTVNEWVNQNAFGGAYRYLFANQIWHSLDLSGYYIHANDKNLSNAIFYQNDIPMSDLRRIAGGTEETVLANFTLTPLHRLLVTLGGGYSHLVYDTEYESNQETSTVAYNAGLEYLLTSRTKFGASITNSAAETDSTIKVSQIFPKQIEAAVTGQYSQGQAGQPNSSSLTLALSFPVTAYTATPDDSLGSLKDWIENPVIRAPRVLAIKDEKVVAYSIDASNPPLQNLKTGQAIQDVYTKDIFNFDPSLYDKVEYSLSVVDPNHIITNPSQLNLDVKSDGSSAYNAIIYSTAPLSNSVTPNGGPNTYQVIITATGYKNGLAQPVTAQADLELDVNFDPNNEPQWGTKGDGAIAFDQTAAPSSIKLNDFLSTDPGQPVTFSIVSVNPLASSAYWDIQTNGSSAYLVRKKDSSGAFYAKDINATTPQNIVVTVKYADDPAGTVGPQTTLKITVKPDPSIKFVWNNSSACSITGAYNGGVLVEQPTNSQTYPINLSTCVQYEDANNNPIQVSNDSISYAKKDAGGYPDSINLNGSALTVNGPTNNTANSLNKQYTFILNVMSTAQGSSSANPYPVTATNLINVGNTLQVDAGSNKYQFDGTANDVGFKSSYTSMVIYNLDTNKTYTFTSDAATDNPPLQIKVCPSSITNVTSYNDPNSKCVATTNTMNVSSQTGSIVWWVPIAFDYPTVSKVTLTQN